MTYTREDDRKLAEAMGQEVWRGRDWQDNDYMARIEIGKQYHLPPYLSAPTPASDYDCLLWARAYWPNSELESKSRQFQSFLDKTESIDFWWFLDYQPGMIARALYAVLMEE